MNNNIGKNLMLLRKEKKLKVDDVAKFMKEEMETIVEWEMGAKVPNAAQLARLGAIFDIEYSILFDEPKVADVQPQNNTTNTQASWQMPANVSAAVSNTPLYDALMTREVNSSNQYEMHTATAQHSSSNVYQQQRPVNKESAVLNKKITVMSAMAITFAIIAIILFSVPILRIAIGVGFGWSESATANTFDFMFNAVAVSRSAMFVWFLFFTYLTIIGFGMTILFVGKPKLRYAFSSVLFSLGVATVVFTLLFLPYNYFFAPGMHGVAGAALLPIIAIITGIFCLLTFVRAKKNYSTTF